MSISFKCPRCGHAEIHDTTEDRPCTQCCAPLQIINHKQTPAEEMICRYECGEQVADCGEICNVCQFSSVKSGEDPCEDCNPFNCYKEFKMA